MSVFPQITEDDLKEFNTHLTGLIVSTEASLVLIVEKAGHLIYQCGETDKFDGKIIATLASNAYNASAYLATLLNETKITGMIQQGEKFSTMILEIDENSILVIVFKSTLSAGAIKYFASLAIPKIASQIKIAKERSPSLMLDLTDLNVANAEEFLRKSSKTEKTTPSEVQQQIFQATDQPESSIKTNKENK